MIKKIKPFKNVKKGDISKKWDIKKKKKKIITVQKTVFRKKKFFEKKIIGKILFPKQITRNKVGETTFLSRRKEGLINVYTFDNNANISSTTDSRQTQRRLWVRRRRKRKERSLRKRKKKTRMVQGRSLVLQNNIVLKARLNFDIYIKSFIAFRIKHNSTYLLRLQKMFKHFKIDQEEAFPYYTRTLIILRPIKGGYKAYASGIIGFLPKKHSVKIFKTLRKKIGVVKLKQKWSWSKKRYYLLRSCAALRKRTLAWATKLWYNGRTNFFFKKRKLPSQLSYFFTTNLKIRVGFRKKNFSKTKKYFRKKRTRTRFLTTTFLYSPYFTWRK